MFSFVSYLIQQRHIQNPVEHNNGAFWLKKLTAFPESLFRRRGRLSGVFIVNFE